MTPMQQVDLDMVVRRLPADVKALMREHPLFLAGGFIREVISGAAVQDIDLFGPSKPALDDASIMLLIKRTHPSAHRHETQYAYTVLTPPRVPVQFIFKWSYDNAEQLLKELDFTVCQAVVWHGESGWQSLCAPTFYSDLAARRLVYTFPVRAEAAGGSLMRVRKFLARGYNIQVHSLAGVVARLIGGIDANRIGGPLGEGRTLEEARHLALKGLLHEVDPLVVVDSVEPKDDEEAE